MVVANCTRIESWGRQLKQRDVVPALFYSGGPTEIDLWEIATEILQELVEAE